MAYKAKKNGKHHGMQTYRCLSCLKFFQSKKRVKQKVERVWNLYTKRRQIVKDISEDTLISPRSIYRILDKQKRPTYTLPPTGSHLMIVMDCTYFKRICAYFVVRDWYTKRNIYFKRIPYETINCYTDFVWFLKSKGYLIDGIIVDGRRGIFQALSAYYPIQMCQFHQKQIVKRYLTQNPLTAAGQELQKVMEELTLVDREWFEILLYLWNLKYELFIKEKTINPTTGKWHYTHKRIRSAYRSLKNNIPYLFTYQTMKNMPNTTNSLDGYFSHLKNAVSVHRGLRLWRKTKVIESLIVG